MSLIQRALKRSVDFWLAAVLLALAAPLIALVALAIVLESGGPVFYRAERVGFKGQRLRMLKFRKMRSDAHGRPLTLGDDERFTRVGRWLAQAKLDELPQLWHVLRGEMSLIGPRPEDPGFVAERISDYQPILEVRPGVTGLSQLAFARESEILCRENPLDHYRHSIFPQKIGLDYLYAQRSSLVLDLQIAFWTVAAILLRRQVAVHRDSAKMTLRRR